MLSIQAFKKTEELTSNIVIDYKIKTAPIPIEEIIKKIGLNIFEYNLGDDVSGVLVITNNQGTIGYNPKDNYLRQRFTMAHELGHFVMHKENAANELFVDKDFLFKKFRNANTYTPLEKRQEQEANAFAAALLMPKSFIDFEMDKEELSALTEVELVSELARRFKVSEVAMSYRLANLNSYFG